MPAQKRLYENTDEDLPENNHENHQEQQQQQGEESDRSASSSSGRDQDEFILVRLSDIRKEVQCPICLGIIKKTRTVMECLHRFCRECIDKSMRMGNNECPACRTHCASRRSLRDDPNYDALIAALFPDIDQYEEEELAFHEEEKARNNQIQALIAQTFQRQSEALSKKRRRSQGILRRRRNYRSDDNANANDAGKDSSSADERCTEVFWPSSPVQKPRPLVRMANPVESRGVIIRTRHTVEGFSGPPPEKVTETPSSSSSLIDYAAAGICARAGSTAGLEKTYEDWPADSGVVLAQPAPQAVPGAESMESLEGPTCETVTATQTYAVEPIAGLNSSAAASEAVREEPTASAPELAREEPAAAMDETDAFLDRILDEAAANLAREDAPGPSSSDPQPTGPGLESRPARPLRKIYDSRRLISAISREMEHRDLIIANREAEIAWLEARLAASGGELREQTAALEAVMAGMEAENAELKAEIACLKEEDDRHNKVKKWLADRITDLENDLALRIRPIELEGMLYARLLEGINVGRHIAQLIDPNFPAELINQYNRAAQRKEDLVGDPP